MLESDTMFSGDKLLEGRPVADKRVLVVAFGPTGAWAARLASDQGAARVDWASMSGGELGAGADDRNIEKDDWHKGIPRNNTPSNDSVYNDTMQIDRTQSAADPKANIHTTTDRIVHIDRQGDGAVVTYAHGPAEHDSIQRTHIHLIVEASDRLALAKGMQVFGISAAKHINAAVPPRNGRRRRGTVFADRYHGVILTTPTQVRNTLRYVLNNWRHHGEHVKPLRKPWKIDPYSTALAFDGWKERADIGTRYRVPIGYDGPLVWLPKTWLLRAGWRKRGLISIYETPGSGAE